MYFLLKFTSKIRISLGNMLYNLKSFGKNGGGRTNASHCIINLVKK